MSLLLRNLLSRSIPAGVRCTTSAAALNDALSKQLDEIRAAGTIKYERVITSPQSSLITVREREGHVLNFCANNYLGLSSHPEVIEAAKRALDSYGNGLSSTRFICGTLDIHKELEEKIARFHKHEDAVLYASCFDANAGLFEALLSPEDAIFSDELNHASIIDGIRLAKARKHRYKHLDMAHLESLLQEASDARFKLIVSDGVFSMDGSVAPLPDMCRLADQYGAMVFLDECHATGFLGDTGRGTEEFHGLIGEVDIINSTLGKALGGALGGYTTGSKEVVSILRNKSRPYLFSNTLPPSVVAPAIKVFDLLMSDRGNEIAGKLHSNTHRFRERMLDAGFTLKGEEHPIVPVMLGDAKLAAEFADEMLHKGIYVIGFSFPVVAKGQARIRVQISALHKEEDIDRCVDTFIEIGRAKGVIS